MSEHFACIATDFDTEPLLARLNAHPELWDEYPERLTAPNSPHFEAHDIWFRYRARAELTTPESYISPHISQWYPSALIVPEIIDMAGEVRALTGCHKLGGVLVTHIPPGHKVWPHDDRGSWHAEYYDYKVYVCLRGNDECPNYFDGDWFTMKPGEVWRFDNLVTHACFNNGKTDRMSAIFSMRAN